MRIGFYKPGHKICFQEDADDHSAISVEVTRIIRIFSDHGDECFILSDTDYIPGTIKNVSKGGFGTLDKVYIYNGKGFTREHTSMLRTMAPILNLIVTDLSLLPPFSLDTFNDVYTQSTQLCTYGAIQEHECYRFTPEIYKKDIHIYFGGTERGRSADFFEYIMHEGIEWNGKSETLGIKKYIPYAEHIKKMKRAKYSIVIGDESYNKIGFITPRYFECIKYGVIPMVDYKYDPYELMISKTDCRRVLNYTDMMSRIKDIDKNPDMYDRIISEQNYEMTEGMITGNDIYRLLQ